MVSKEDLADAKKAFKLAEKALKDLEEKELSEGDKLHKLFIIFENCINCMKGMRNGRPIKESHSLKTTFYNTYFDLGILKKDYSENHKRINKLRQIAIHGPYARDRTHPTNSEELEKFTKEAKELVKETKEDIRKMSEKVGNKESYY